LSFWLWRGLLGSIKKEKFVYVAHQGITTQSLPGLVFCSRDRRSGLLCAWRIPIDILPVFKAPAVSVLTYYPGMSASGIEKTITNRMERWVSQAPGVRSVESRSVPGVSVVKAYFREDIDSNEALTLVNSLALGLSRTSRPILCHL
jgi:hypothetical protein